MQHVQKLVVYCWKCVQLIFMFILSVGMLPRFKCFSNKNATEKKKYKKKHKTMWMGGRRNETNINQFSDGS